MFSKDKSSGSDYVRDTSQFFFDKTTTIFATTITLDFEVWGVVRYLTSEKLIPRFLSETLVDV